MKFIFLLARYVKVALVCAIFLIFVRAIFFPSILDMFILLILCFVLFVMLIGSP